MPNQWYPPRNREESPSKRWQTTMRSQLEDVASQLKGSYDRGGMVRALQDRKQANTKTSISFGNHQVSYVSDCMEQQLKSSKAFASLTAEDRAAQKHRIAAMKGELTTTNFTLGDDVPHYESVNHESMKRSLIPNATTAPASPPRGGHGHGVDSLHDPKALKEAIKRSSIHFGNERVQYRTVAHDAMEPRGTPNDFGKLRQEVTEMKKTLTRHNFSFGDEKVHYESDYHRGYGSLPTAAYVHSKDKKDGMRRVIEDSRSAHFSLGNDRPVYQSNTHAALRVVTENANDNDIAGQLERARQMKAALQKTSIVIGDDADYY